MLGAWGESIARRLHSVFGGRGPCREEVHVCRGEAIANFFVDFELLNLQCRKFIWGVQAELSNAKGGVPKRSGGPSTLRFGV